MPAGLIALPGVYQPQVDTRLLAQALAQETVTRGTEVLEIGTGTGALALHAACRGARVTAIDVCWRANVPALLRPGGVLLMVHSGMCGSQETVDRFGAAGLGAEVTSRALVPWGPVLRSRRAWLERQGLATDAEELEELVVIRAQNL
ncbi:hypothetical protein ACFYZ4_02700 [Streptomyces sp. NPDC001513]|uniref:hypothetical protein n=1 Tax=Streptomyces sp. NPDC001513 TaxID=3364580 RepID=UPI0036C6CDDF